MTRRILCLFVLSGALIGGSCGGGDGGGSQSFRSFESPDPRCLALGSQFPAGFAFVPGRTDLVWAMDFSPPTFLPIDVSVVPPALSASPSPLLVPSDSDGNGSDETFLVPIIDDVDIPRDDLALVTSSSYEEIILFDPTLGELRSFDVSVDPAFAAGDYPLLPAPGTTAPRTALSTFACIRPPPGALDSRGEPIATSVSAAGFCEAGVPSYLSSFTSGAALVGERLFVSTSNLGNDAGTTEPQYLPGSVLVYDIDLSVAPPTLTPNAATPVLLTSGFNPTQVTGLDLGGRRFVLVTLSGAIGVEPDDPGTSEIEGAGVALTDAAIDVIDADTLNHVATIPLARAGLAFNRLAVDPTQRVAAIGSAIQRWLLAIDLEPLATLPAAPPTPLILDGSTGPNAVLFDGSAPFQIPARSDGAPSGTCPGFTAGVAFNDAGTALYLTDFCDGTLTQVDVALDAGPPAASQFSIGEQLNVTAALRADTLGERHSPGALQVRPGEPGVDFDGPDVFLTVGDPGLLCGIEVESS